MASSMVPQEISILLSSDPANGALNVSSDGSQFEVQLQDAIQIPREAQNVTISSEESTVWFVVPNIITGVNDKMYVDGPDTLDVTQSFVITIPQGLYNSSQLNSAVLRELENAGAKVSPDPIINIGSDTSTNKIIIRFNYAVSEVDFTPSDTFRDILGFNSQVVGPFAGAPQNVLADNVAAFNTINSFLLHSDLVSQGLRLNNDYNQILTQVLIDVVPGKQIVSTPFNPPKINAQDLAGSSRTNIRMWLTDEANNPVNTNTEFFTTRIVIRYLIPVVSRS